MAISKTSVRIPTEKDVIASTTAMKQSLPALETITGTSPVGGASTTGFAFTFPTAFSSPPIVWGTVTAVTIGLVTYIVIPLVTNIEATKCTVVLWRSKATLVLSAGPFEIAPAATPFSLVGYGCHPIPFF